MTDLQKEANAKQAAYAEHRRKAREHVQSYYASIHGAGIVGNATRSPGA